MTKSYRQVENDILMWSTERRIIPNSTPQSQTLKLVSEVGELAEAVNKGDLEATVDAVGDTMVCLVNVCALLDIDLVACMEVAYDEIKNRKGTLLPSGVFVKEG